MISDFCSRLEMDERPSTLLWPSCWASTTINFRNRYSKEDFIQLVTRMKEGADINSLDVWDQNRIYRELYEQIALDQVLNLKWFNREGEALENPRQNDSIIQTMMGLQNNNHAQTANEAQDPQSDSTSSIHFEDDQKVSQSKFYNFFA
ncbi:unnamed protein product [Moneuplotes crassus]|uniref:Uncharacterized protein n=1 Tax=Euplotes crassus TaxID=5936 RepID=A0AAD1XBE0_EUPCR|nr:unnamed protein product [Moneuplotes crassus]